LVIRRDFFSVFLGWEGLGVTSFLLIIYYQNWRRFRGGLLTLLTNRLGDGLLLLSFAYWISLSFPLLLQGGRIILFLIFLLTALTKSAQVPFTSWLPAAIAAPTPVRALVHSSTLVTAGIWLIIRFRQLLESTALFWLILGSVTIILARLAALLEVDGKKVVALSTLSQLGLIFVSLALGNWLICLFHLLMHAFAKANLFLMVGNLLHARFSQQDSRYLSSGLMEVGTVLISLVRVFRLRGVVFFRGFFSKDRILFREFSLITSSLIPFIIVGVITLTIVYCIKLIFSFVRLQTASPVFPMEENPTARVPSLILVRLRTVLGFWFFLNTNYIIIYKRSSGINWVFLGLALLLLGFLPTAQSSLWGKLFYLQVTRVKLLAVGFSSIGKTGNQKVSSIVERRYLVFTIASRRNFLTQLVRGRIISFCLILLVVCF